MYKEKITYFWYLGTQEPNILDSFVLFISMEFKIFTDIFSNPDFLAIIWTLYLHT